MRSRTPPGVSPSARDAWRTSRPRRGGGSSRGVLLLAGVVLIAVAVAAVLLQLRAPESCSGRVQYPMLGSVLEEHEHGELGVGAVESVLAAGAGMQH